MVEPCGATLPCGWSDRVGAQLVECCGAGGAVCCKGVAGAGGACATAAAGAAVKRLATTSLDRVRIPTNDSLAAGVPVTITICGHVLR